nr:uncharacterized mitochondrial protein AtMg00810-like [Tanacetum cinerariifolium]
MSNNESVNESDEVSTINSFYHYESEPETKTSTLRPNDDEEGSSSRDGEQNTPEGNVGSDNEIHEVPVFQNVLPNVIEDGGLRMSQIPSNCLLDLLDSKVNLYMHAPLKSHLDMALRVIEYLKLAHGLGVEFLKRKGIFGVVAYSDSE